MGRCRAGLHQYAGSKFRLRLLRLCARLGGWVAQFPRGRRSQGSRSRLTPHPGSAGGGRVLNVFSRCKPPFGQPLLLAPHFPSRSFRPPVRRRRLPPTPPCPPGCEAAAAQPREKSGSWGGGGGGRDGLLVQNQAGVRETGTGGFPCLENIPVSNWAGAKGCRRQADRQTPTPMISMAE